MKWLSISTIAVTLILVATNLVGAHRPGASYAAGKSLQIAQVAAGVPELPMEEFEDLSLVFSRTVKH